MTDVPCQNWPPPRAPLPPHRLANLANALGVAVPAASPDPYRRSPTPSAPPVTSKFLLHVLPPHAFPSDPPPASPSGYHTHFRRGILVPVHASFQSQLAAIAKEYALPSSVGLVLYLITEQSEEPGPLLSEDIWKHLWTRVLRFEQRDDSLPPTPGLLSLRTAPASRSTPHLPTSLSLRPFASTPTAETPLPLPNAPSPSTPSSVSDPPSVSKSVPGSSQGDPDTPDTSAASNAFDAQLKAQSLDLPGLHSPSLIPILAKVEFDIDLRKAVWYEPWLRSRKANHAKRAESRSARLQSTNEEDTGDHARKPPIQLIIGQQRTASPLSMFASPVDPDAVVDSEPTPHEQAEITGYRQLSDGEDSESDPHGDGRGLTAPITSIHEKDPLADVFGSDADTWADIRAAGSDKKLSDSGTINLALTAADLNDLPNDDLQEPRPFIQPEEEEVRELLQQMSHSGSLLTTPHVDPLPLRATPSSSSTHTAKKHVPPPLMLGQNDTNIHELVVPSESSPWPSSAGSVGLAYLHNDSSPRKASPTGYSEGEIPEELHHLQSSAESEKRIGAFYDELDLGLDPTEDFDEDDPNDRRRSQFLFRAQLDEIERTMAQFSPRVLKSELEGDGLLSSPGMSNSNSPLPSPGMLNAAYHTSSPSLRVSDGPKNIHALNHQDRVQGPPRSSSTGGNLAAWPAVPFSSIRESQGSGSSYGVDEPPSTPGLALNGVTTSAPKSFVAPSSNAVSAETEQRKRELEEECPAPAKASDPVTADSPTVPLTPDPFGRYPSSTLAESTIRGHNSNSSYQGTRGQGSSPLGSVAEGETTSVSRERGPSTSSRFSADSITIVGDEVAPAVKPSMKNPLITVRSIKRLWRRSNNRSNSSNTPGSTPPVPPTRSERPSREMVDPSDISVPKLPTSLSSTPVPPTRPERPSEETMDFPDIIVPTPPSSFRALSTEQNQSPPLSPARVSQDQDRFPAPHTLQSQDVPLQDHINGPSGPTSVSKSVPPYSKPGLKIPQTTIGEGFSASPSLPSQEGYSVPTSPSEHPDSLLPGLHAPPYVGRKANTPLIVPAQMLPGRGGSFMNKFHFDQESPYPIHMSPSPRYSPRPLSPPSPTTQPHQSGDVRQQSQVLPSSLPDKDKSTRRSILKSFQKPSNSSSPIPSESRSSIDRPNLPSFNASRSRRPSFHSTKSSMNSNDIPASLQIQNSGKNGMVSSPGLTNTDPVSSIDATTSRGQNSGRSVSPPPGSMISSRSSVETRPSFDVSQFEIVSPKTTNLTNPYS